jgi:hypothetical protein
VVETEIQLRINCAPKHGNNMQNGRREFSQWNEEVRAEG